MRYFTYSYTDLAIQGSIPFLTKVKCRQCRVSDIRCSVQDFYCSLCRTLQRLWGIFLLYSPAFRCFPILLCGFSAVGTGFKTALNVENTLQQQCIFFTLRAVLKPVPTAVIQKMNRYLNSICN